MPRRGAFGQAFREKLAESTPSAKLMVRGRASRSRHKSDVATVKEIADYLPTKKLRGYTKLYERVPKYTTISFGMRELYPRMKSDSAATADAVAVIRFLDPRALPTQSQLRGDKLAVRIC